MVEHFGAVEHGRSYHIESRYPYPVLVNFLFRLRGLSVPPAADQLKKCLRRNIEPSDNRFICFMERLAVLS
jgi:hypothetical protein